MTSIKEKIRSLLEQYEIPFTVQALNLSAEYISFLLKENKKINLVSRNDTQNILSRHFLDSLILLKIFTLKENAAVLDLGSGGGFPALPLKIFRPDLRFTLFESNGKKSAFLKSVCTHLSLPNISIHPERLTKKTVLSLTFDYCTSRAVGETRELVKLCGQFVDNNGCFFTFKQSSFIQEELNRFSSKFQNRYTIEKKSYYLPGRNDLFYILRIYKGLDSWINLH